MSRFDITKLIAAILAGFLHLQACANDPAEEAVRSAACRSSGPSQLGDAPVFEGKISRQIESFEFRTCDNDEHYLVDASYAIIDTLDQAVHADPGGGQAPVYVRFHAEVIEYVDNLPDRYLGIIRITELLVHDQVAPVDCK